MAEKRKRGRPKGSVNKATADIKALAQAYTPEALKTLVAHMRSDNPKASLVACREIINRGHGMPVQFSEATIEHRSVARIPLPAATAEEWAADHAPAVH